MKTVSKILKLTLFGILALALLIVALYGYKDIPLEELKTKYANAPSKFISVDGMEVHYRDEGDASDSIPIVLIHGTGSSLHTFNDWTVQLSKNHRVIRLDIPAYGLTGPFPNRDYSTAHYVVFINNFLKALDIKNCILAGNSLGGGIAWNFTAAYPHMVDKLILIDASGYPSASKSVPIAFKLAQTPVLKNIFTFITPRFVAKQSIENVYADKSKVTKAMVDRYFELTLREGNRQAFVDRLGTEKDTTAYKNIKTIRQPTLILWGDQDELIPPKMAHRFHEDLPNSELVILKGVGHVPMEERPDKSLEVVLSFLKNN